MSTEEVTRLDVAVDGVPYCAQFEITFNGKVQTDCLIADSKKGYIMRFRKLFGVLAHDRGGRPMTEEKWGKVTIARKPTPKSSS